jgi:2-amino-4-hydroxy-6-hydroxymethyldihydropteridine diphosphokinase
VTIVYFSLGSNIGDRLRNLKQAVHQIERTNTATCLRLSSIVETTPQYVIQQPPFFNQVICGETSLAPMELLQITQDIEARIGRARTFLNGPRIIDIDLISYGNTLMDTQELVLPHPRLYERCFVLEPLLELEPEWSCPRTGKSVVTLWKENDQKTTLKTGRIIQRFAAAEHD